MGILIMFDEYIRDKQNEITDSLLGCVRINSVEGEPEESMPFGRGPAEALEYALKLAGDMGFRTVNIDNQVGYAEYGDGEEMIAVLGHLDIVPAGDGWSHDPFGETDGDRIYGRGTLDDKGSMIGALYALDAVRKSGLPLKRRVRIIFGTNEETGSMDMVRYNATEEQPAMAFTPDADYPVIFSEKGIARVTISMNMQNRDGDTALCCGKAGDAVNIVPQEAHMTLINADGTRLELEAEGIPAHGSTPELGENAVSKLMQKAGECELCGDIKTFIEFYNRHIGTETDGASLGIACSTEKFGATTVNVGLLEGDADHIRITLDCRYPAGEDFAARFENAVKNAAEYGLTAELAENTEPLYVPEDSFLVQTLQEVYRQQTGDEAEPVVIGG
ncbi:MAG: Sapep family Mn(2+)-dependent dipeptidase, partial [Lentihominibacter sp.]